MNKFKALGWSQKISVVAILLVLLVLPLSLFSVYQQARLGSQAATLKVCDYTGVPCRTCCEAKYCIGFQKGFGCSNAYKCEGNTKYCCYRCNVPAPVATTTPAPGVTGTINCDYSQVPCGACCEANKCIGFKNTRGCPAKTCEGGSKYCCARCKP